MKREAAIFSEEARASDVEAVQAEITAKMENELRAAENNWQIELERMKLDKTNSDS